MNSAIFRIAAKSFLFYSKTTVNQIIIVALLAAVITGSLFTGYSVRNSLKLKAAEKLGNTDILLSSGLRFFNASLAGRMGDRIEEKAVSIFESDGYVQNFSTGLTALNVKIYGIDNDFFRFQDNDSLTIIPGTVALNERLAQYLSINEGDEITIRFREMDPLPANAPFAPTKGYEGSVVMKVGKILNATQSGNFSLGISQIVPMNVFVSLSDLKTGNPNSLSANRILIKNTRNYNDSAILNVLKELLRLDDVGLTLRRSERTGQTELISDRIFIDSAIVSGILQRIPSAWPLITYLANSITTGIKSTPYSFVTALPPQDYGPIADDEIIAGTWLSEDIGAMPGDTLRLTWFDPGSGRILEEKSKDFVVKTIIDNSSELLDPSFMPDFPGIAGSSTCSAWDAGIPILLDKIRGKDEEYWNLYKGTPKAFISYKTGRMIWGNNFGPATAIRFPQSMDPGGISEKLSGSIDPSLTGFTISDIHIKSRNAAEGGVDFSMLFLALGMFIIISCVILLSLSVSTFFDSRRDQHRTYFALGFKNKFIKNLLLLECLLYSAAGAVPGVFLGFLINKLIINALNSVWMGAVQTDTITAQFGLLPLVSGFVVTVFISGILIIVKVRSFLKNLDKAETGVLIKPGVRPNFILFLLSFLFAAVILILSFFIKESAIILSFVSGTLFFVAFVLALRHYYIINPNLSSRFKNFSNLYSRKYYSFNPAQAITPVIFIAAGIFAVIITGANRQVLDDRMLLPAGGTGGYQLWIETAVPLIDDLNLPSGKKEFGLNEPELKDLKFVQAGKVTGDDASCLNLNHVTSPPLLGVDPEQFVEKGSFSFATSLGMARGKNPWSLLDDEPGSNVIYGIADQTVMQWGLKIKAGDTLKYRSENGQLLNIVICAGLKSSVFQGYLIIGEKKLRNFFPSVAGSTVFLADGNPELSGYYREVLGERLSGYGASIETAGEKLASFFEVSNTYLDVFTILGVFGMILGVAGMGFILIRNYNQRKREFALMMATGYSITRIRRLLLYDQVIILLWGVFSGTICGFISTLPSLKSGSEIPWNIISLMVIAIITVGSLALLLSVRMVRDRSLVVRLRKE